MPLDCEILVTFATTWRNTGEWNISKTTRNHPITILHAKYIFFLSRRLNRKTIMLFSKGIIILLEKRDSRHK